TAQKMIGSGIIGDLLEVETLYGYFRIPQLSLSINWTGNTFIEGFISCSMDSIIDFVAISSISTNFIFIAVSGGFTYLADSISSNPITEISSGTLRPLSWIALIAPNAILSLLAKIAENLLLPLSNFFAASYPAFSTNSLSMIKLLFIFIPASSNAFLYPLLLS